MKKIKLLVAFAAFLIGANAQDKMTPELLWKLGRVSAVGLSKDGEKIVYKVTTPDVAQNKTNSKTYVLPLKGGVAKEIVNADELVKTDRISPDGKMMISAKDVKMKPVFGKDIYTDLDKSNVQVYDHLNYRHWDEWEDGAFSHVFVHAVVNGKPGEGKDIMTGQYFDCPQKPFGGNEDFIWSPDSKSVIYVTKAKFGTEYAVSTNTDIYQYDIASAKTSNLSFNNKGYDMAPAFSSQGVLAWLSMKRDGYEADKNDIVVRNVVGEKEIMINLTKDWDGTVESFKWGALGKKIYFTAAWQGTKQLYEVDYPVVGAKANIKMLTNGRYDVGSMAGQVGNTMVVSRTDMNHAAELYSVDLTSGAMVQLTHVNDAVYEKIGLSKVEAKWVTTTDKKQMLVYVIYPPDFDPAKKYPTLLYCQGGPQSPLSQSYSFRWNFQLMAANGYIIVAPNRRGMPGHGVKWNEDISKDWGGQVMNDYLSAIDEVSKEPYVDKTRLGAVGASYGGYSVFYLAGIHNNRFKTFISHDGVFNLRSMYGTTEEMFFENFDKGGAYWEKDNKAAQKSFNQFDPSSMVAKWNKPILIIQGGKDYRVPIGQGLEAFNAAQLQGIKSKLIYFPEENHWVLKPQNALVWQREFYKWLRETL